MKKLIVFNRTTETLEEEIIYGKLWLDLLYGSKWWQKLLSFFLLPICVHSTLLSRLYGYFQKKKSSQKKIIPFIKAYNIDSSEFAISSEHYQSFNDFFIRKLKKDARPLASSAAILPADGRYLCFENIEQFSTFSVKNETLTLSTLLQDEELSKEFEGGSLTLARLCPTDYHRFHFPVDAIFKRKRLINGSLFSVNPMAWTQRLKIFCQNKRYCCELESPIFGNVLIIPVGATNVGSVHFTSKEGQFYKKGDELAYFSFGGSALILLFKKNNIVFSSDLLKNSSKKLEVKALFGQTLGEHFK